MSIRVAIVDDNNFLIKSIEEKLSCFNDIQIKHTSSNGHELLEKIEENQHLDLILMDIEMPSCNGIEATALVKAKYPQIKIIMLTAFDDDAHIFNAIKAGADGYLLKEVNPEALHKSIVDTLEGGAAMTPSIALKTLKLLRHPQIPKASKETVALSSREIEVLEQLSKGLSYTKIATNLFLSPSTVRKHIENIYKKLQVHSKIEAVEKARQQHLI